jgi:cytoskeleton protein RodZ
MGSFGDRLRREREMRGVTLDEISASTKIARRHLEELESENFDALPGGVFNRGFVRAYARFLGIDEDQAVADYLSASGEQSQSEPTFPVEIQPEAEPQLNPRRSSLPLLLALLALVVVLAIFWARNKRQPEVSENSTVSPTSAATPSPTALASVEPSPSPSASTRGAPSSAASPATPAPFRNLATAQPGLQPSLAAEHTFSVKVEVKEDAWLNVTADGKTVIPGKTFRAGAQQVVRAGQKIVLVTGNAGGIDITFNGKPLGPVGNESEVRTLTFTPAGLVQ